jgi:hypothetical protein
MGQSWVSYESEPLKACDKASEKKKKKGEKEMRKRERNISMIVISVILFVLAIGPTNVFAQVVNAPSTNVDPIVDGSRFSFAGEYAQAVSIPGNGGTIYVQYKQNWNARSVQTGNQIVYANTTLFELNDLWSAPTREINDYNFFSHVYPPGGTNISVWIFAEEDDPDDSDWIGLSGLGYANVDDRGFLVRKNNNPATDVQWLPGQPEPGDPGWNWNAYHGVFASSYTRDGWIGNEVYEVAWHNTGNIGDEPPLDPCYTMHVGIRDPTCGHAGAPELVWEGDLHIGYRGSDYLSPTTATIGLEITGLFNEIMTANGPTTVARSLPYDPGDGRIKIDTEIVSMNLVGNSAYIGPITIIESPSKKSNGTIQQRLAGVDFPADSFFDVFVEIQTMFGILHNDDPVVMYAEISSIPPWGSNYTSSPVHVPLKDHNETIVGFINHASHLIVGPSIIPGKTKDYVGQGYTQIILAHIDNDASTRNFTVATYYDGLQPIGNATVTLNPLEHAYTIIKWTETATWPKGTYNCTLTINTYTNETLHYATTFSIMFKITIVGDVNGDSKVDIKDILIVAKAYGSYPSPPRWNPNADVNCDDKVDIKDILITAKNYGKTDV